MKTLGLSEALKVGLAWQRHDGVAIVHIVRSGQHTEIDVSQRLVVSGTGEVAGDFSSSIRSISLAVARESIDRQRSRIYSLLPTTAGGEVIGMQGGEVDIFVEVLPVSRTLVIAGAGHIAQPVAVLGGLLGFAVTVIDDRAEFATPERFPEVNDIRVMDFVQGLKESAIDGNTFVVLVTRGHVHDLACLRFVLGCQAAYVGMIGSKMRIRTVMNHLRAEGFTEEQLGRVYAPIGIDIGSHTPAEIAVAIAAEIVDVYRGGRCLHLSLRRDSRE